MSPFRAANDVRGGQSPVFMIKATTSARLLLVLPAIVIVVTFLVFPVGHLLLMSFNPAVQGEIAPTARFTLQNYARLMLDPFYLAILMRSIVIAATTTIVAAGTGYVLALSLWRASKGIKSYLAVLVLAPLLISVVVRTFGWIVILGDRGVLNSALTELGIIEQPLQIMFTRVGIVIGLIHVFLPFMALSILSSLERIDPAVPEAARTLGAGSWAVHWHIIIPLATPGFAAGTTIIFSLAISAYVTPMLMGSGSTDTITTLVYQQFMVVYNWHFGAALTAALLAVTSLILTLIIFVFGRISHGWIAR